MKSVNYPNRTYIFCLSTRLGKAPFFLSFPLRGAGPASNPVLSSSTYYKGRTTTLTGSLAYLLNCFPTWYCLHCFRSCNYATRQVTTGPESWAGAITGTEPLSFYLSYIRELIELHGAYLSFRLHCSLARPNKYWWNYYTTWILLELAFSL